jgi:hypothetical protein
VAKEKFSLASRAQGWLSCLEDIWSKLHPPENPSVDPDEPFIDPATIREPQR